ncbi:MAG TPA: shikimate dehydrogenase [Rhizomicrobium sp.]|nr:shikimate dehydrogenase [Rhizomicrobium sp.]
MTKRAGIIGWPVSHSLSPVLHGYWLEELGIDGEYTRLAARPDEFAATVARARSEGFAGLNVTVPHKEAAYKLARPRDAAAEICGAVNLLVFGDKGPQGRNTDYIGMQESLAESLGENALKGKTVLLLGAGGAARAAILALHELGVAQIHVLNRSQARAESLSNDMALKVKPRLVPGPLTGWASLAGTAGLLLNTTSAGMIGNDELVLDLSLLPREAAVCDIVYNPLETGLLKNAAKRGHRIIDGLGMLMHQAVPSFEAFFGVKPKVTPGLRAALVQDLHAR